jgi:hypothetical protein
MDSAGLEAVERSQKGDSDRSGGEFSAQARLQATGRRGNGEQSGEWTVSGEMEMRSGAAEGEWDTTEGWDSISVGGALTGLKAGAKAGVKSGKVNQPIACLLALLLIFLVNRLILCRYTREGREFL